MKQIELKREFEKAYTRLENVTESDISKIRKTLTFNVSAGLIKEVVHIHHG